MPRSHRGRSTPRSLILPFALTLTTAALASAGLYFFSAEQSPPSSYPGSDSDHEPLRRRRKATNKRPDRVPDHITEEDTDAIEESRREEDLFYKRRRATGVVAYMKGAAVGAMEAIQGDNEEPEFDEDENTTKQSRRQATIQNQSFDTKRGAPKLDTTFSVAPAPIFAGGGGGGGGGAASSPREKTTPAVPISAVKGRADKPQQYVPPPKRKKTVVVVVQERKATQGHESDEDFEEALLPARPLLSQLPRPLNLANTNLYILIHSPHLSSHPLSTPAQLPAPQTLAVSTDTLATQAPSPMPSPSLQAQRLHEDFNKSSYELAVSLLPASTPRENIMPFNTHPSLMPMLKQLSPEVVYFEEAVVDSEGKIVDEILGNGWVGRVVIVVGGDDLDGLLSDDDEGLLEKRRGEGKWWGENGAVRNRHGKRFEVVEKWALEDDWRRRVEEY